MNHTINTPGGAGYLQTIWEETIVPIAGENDLYHTYGNSYFNFKLLCNN